MNRRVRVFYSDREELRDDAVSDEELVTVYVNGLKFISIFALPRHLDKLAVGFLVSEGVCDYEDIRDVKVDGSAVKVEVSGKDRLELLTELRSSGCSGIMQREPEPLDRDGRFSRKVILKSLDNFSDRELEWSATGGTHAAFLMSAEGKRLSFFEDVGRHNALDKVVGWALQESVALGDKFLLFTGRLSSGIVTKAVRVGIPLVVSNTAPLSRALILGDKLGVTLAGFARNSKFNVYSNEWRIKD
ncbi:MAG: formate dehydrogenase accessory sulfurtransferase FdhD [Candidatus Altiarchaeota archaeon]